MAKSTQLQVRIEPELKTLAQNKGFNLSELCREAIRAAVHEDETDENE